MTSKCVSIEEAKRMHALEVEHKRLKALIEADEPVRVRHLLNEAMRNEPLFFGMCMEEGLTTVAQINACRRVIMRLCDKIEKKP